MAFENPAESAVLLSKYNRPFHLHLNDNYRDWDHDMIIGSINLWEMVELFYWLQKINFTGWYGIDIYPYREDGFVALTQSIKYIRKFKEIAKRLKNSELSQLQRKNAAGSIVGFMRKEILR